MSEIKEREMIDLIGDVGEDFDEAQSDGDINDNLVDFSEKV